MGLRSFIPERPEGARGTQSDEAQAIASIFTEHGQELVRLARRVVRSEVDAEDAVQEAMLAVLRAPHLLAVVDRVGAWLYTLVRRRCVDLIRQQQRRRDHELDEALADLFAGQQDPSRLMEQEEFCRAVARAVDDLPPERRHAFVEHALEGRTFHEISDESGVPMGTLMARKKMAVDSIRQQLRRQGWLG